MVTPEGGIPRRNPAPSEAQWLARILEAIPGGIIQVDADGAIVRANEQARRFLGVPWETLSRRSAGSFASRTYDEGGSPWPVEEYPAVRCLATQQPVGPVTMGVEVESGELRWGIFTALPFPEPSGARVGAILTFVDITDRRHAELRARAEDRLLDTVRMVHGRDELGATVAVFHEPLSSLVELTRSQLGFIASVAPDEDPPEELQLHARIDPSDWRNVSQPAVPIDSLSLSVIRTGRRRIVRAPGRLGGAFRNHAPTTAALLPLATAGKVVGIVGLADAPSYDEERLAELEPLLTACADLIAALDERRTRKDLEAQLAQAERLASVGTLAAGMAHEINNPLAYVLLNLQALSRQQEQLAARVARLMADPDASPSDDHDSDGDHEGVRELLGGVHEGLDRIAQNARDATEGAERVRHIVRDLMTFSRVTDEQRSLVDVNAAVGVAVKMAHHEIKYRARLVREPSELARVLGNDGRLSQVFLNLLLNAARAIEEGFPDSNEIRVRTWMDEDEVCVEVADSGHGVRPEHLERLFEPFFSTRAPGAGAGLGLSICHNVVRAHGGRIDVSSELGAGTRFTVRLPASPSGACAPSPPPPAPAPVLDRRLRVLLIDDDPMVLRVLAQLLRRAHDVVCAEGYTAATETLTADEGFDVVVCDMMMLDGTGVDVHSWVLAHLPALAPRMIFMTGGTFTPKARAFLAEVAGHHLSKPFSLKELEAIFRRLLPA